MEDDHESETTPTTSSAGTRLIFSNKEIDILKQANAHLPKDAKPADILHAINVNPEAIKYGLTVSAGRFTPQQLRDKFHCLLKMCFTPTTLENRCRPQFIKGV